MPDQPRAVKADLDARFNHHAPGSDAVAKAHGELRSAMKRAASAVYRHTVTSREQSLALTALEEAMHWANAAVAKHHPHNQGAAK